ncbi:hypothetical protein QTO34_014859 [Cnephaeus nilssonii]|uniref:Uncharacterized protein n=1 Tax=Cnephaeus nilssonii TaxID=3371016 RepID=A0AA40LUQ5_CNENI|nr:hypothetical protein QTO34_014859 [Eptesicus nilssonii]
MFTPAPVLFFLWKAARQGSSPPIKPVSWFSDPLSHLSRLGPLSNSTSKRTKKWKIGSLNGLPPKQEKFYWDGIHKLHGIWGKCVANDGQYFE